MLKKVFGLLIAVVLLFGAFANPAYADDEVPFEVVEYKYLLMDEKPIPEGSIVQFLISPNGDMAVQWEEYVAGGIYTRIFIFKGVALNVNYYHSSYSSSYTSGLPVAGQRVVLQHYGDFENGSGEFGRDNVVDYIQFSALRNWTKDEMTIIRSGNRMYAESVEEGWFYLTYNADCAPSEYRLNGVKIKPGPYGHTYRVPEQGGKLEALYYPGACSLDTNTSTQVRWSVNVVPGSYVGGTEQVYADNLKDLDPWGFCSMLYWMRPVWQDPELPYGFEACENLTRRGDQAPYPTLWGSGFLAADTRSGDDHPNWEVVPFVWHGSNQNIINWPDHTWKRVSNMRVSTGDTYSVTLGLGWRNEYGPVIDLIGGSYIAADPFDSDIPWYGGWGTPILFVPRDVLEEYYFDWYEVQAFRLTRAGNRVVIEELVWIVK